MWKENQKEDMIITDILTDNNHIPILDENDEEIVINSHWGTEGNGAWNDLDS